MKEFNSLAISREMVNNLNNIKYTIMTPIQEKSIPEILKGKDILAQAKTGSGKTAAFGIGLMENLNFSQFRIQGVVICPTRELAEQVTGELRKIGRFRHNIKILTLTGGVPMHKQEHSLGHQAHIVVGTPGRILKLLKRGSLTMDHLKLLVLDEADRMLDMGFIDDIEKILGFTPRKIQTLCFSATFPNEIKELSREFMTNPVEVTVETLHEERVIVQKFYSVNRKEKLQALLTVLKEYNPDNAIIFCNTKNECSYIEKELNSKGLHALALHGDLEQKERSETLIRFTNGSSNILVATDVAARGLDISQLSAVINHDFPFEPETYIHRIGRTGRAGKEGVAVSLLTDSEKFRLDAINEMTGKSFSVESLPQTDQVNNFSKPSMVTLSINGGRKNKISAGDLLGVLTSSGKIKGTDIGKIERQDYLSFVAVKREVMVLALDILENNTIKGKRFKALINE